MRNTRNYEPARGRQPANTTPEVAVRGRRTREAASNSLQFLVSVEGASVDGHVRSANGIRWRLA